MNIAMFSDTFEPQKNGVATALKLYKRELESQGHTVYFFVPKYHYIAKRNEKNVYEFPAFKFIRDKEQRIALPITFNTFKMKELKIDIVHTHSPFSMWVAAKHAARVFNVPLIGTHHTMYEYYRHYLPFFVRPTFNMSKNMIRRWCEKLDRVIAPTEEIRKVLIEYQVDPKEIVVIPTGIDTYSFESPIVWDIRKDYNIPENEKILLFVGRLGKEKNIDFLLKVYKKILLKNNKIKFVIVGDGPENNYLKNCAKELGITDRVVFTGFQPREKVLDAYKQADAFAFASYTETQGLVVLEALAAGTPVIALGKMGVRDLLLKPDTGGIMIDELIEEQFIEKIESVLNNPEYRAELSSKAIKFVEQNYSIKSTTAKLVEVYQEEIDFKKAKKTRG